MTKSKTSPTIRNASDLWTELVKRAALDLKGYDQDVLQELAEEWLSVKPEEFTECLVRRRVSGEELLVNLLGIVQPYAQMFTEVLAFLQRAGARYTNENIRVEFDFGKRHKDLKIDPEQFRDFDRIYRHARALLEHIRIDPVSAAQLRQYFVVPGKTHAVISGRYALLLAEDPTLGAWSPGLMPPPPRTTSSELRDSLEHVWGILTSARLQAGDPPLSEDDIKTIIHGAYRLADDLSLGPRLAAFLKTLLSESGETSSLEDQIVDVLNLPLWRKRHELYSVWVGARLIQALGERAMVHVEDEALIFRFSGTHLATVRREDERGLLIWSELRSPLEKPRGKSRKRGIQPDYVVQREPVSHPDAGVLVVECKQYRRQNTKNFADALIDYARGHPAAHVVLVNYGKITRNVIDRVERERSDVSSRVKAIGPLRPDTEDMLSRFSQIVSSATTTVERPRRRPVTAPTIEPPAEPAAGSGVEPKPAECHEGRAVLSWESPIDLDLHCFVKTERRSNAHVCYGALRLSEEGVTVELDQDTRSGGSETIQWRGSVAALDIYVHAYSTGSIAGLDATVRLETGPSTIVFTPPAEGTGTWWRVCSLDSRTGTMSVHDSILATPEPLA